MAGFDEVDPGQFMCRLRSRCCRHAPAGKNGGQNACTEFMTGLRETRAIGRTGKDVLRFAPNFTAYVLLPDVVCLYSEDRKFFLHGELYCALASAIGKNGKSVQALLGALGGEFPSDKIN